MYAYMFGKVTQIESGFIIIENGNIGYFLYVSNSCKYTLGETRKFYTYLLIKEDGTYLYGFDTFHERNLFAHLLTVNGIGPKSALSIMTGEYNDILQAIRNSNYIYLKQFQGIGDKAAHQIIFTLKNKLFKVENNKNKNDLEDTLESLGYTKKEINNVIFQVDGTHDLTTQVKEALSFLVRK